MNGKPTFDGLPVWWDRRHEDGDPHEEGFWHLITKDDNERAKSDTRSSTCQTVAVVSGDDRQLLGA